MQRMRKLCFANVSLTLQSAHCAQIVKSYTDNTCADAQKIVIVRATCCWSLCRVHNISTVGCQCREQIGYSSKNPLSTSTCQEIQNDNMQDSRLTCASVCAVMLLLPPEGSRGWGNHITRCVTRCGVPVPQTTRLLFYGCLMSNSMQINSATVWYGVLKHFHIHHSFLYAGRSAKERRGLLPSARTLSDSPPPRNWMRLVKTHDSHDYVNTKLLPSIRLQAVCDRTGTGEFLNRWGIQGPLTTPGCWGVALCPPQGFLPH